MKNIYTFITVVLLLAGCNPTKQTAGSDRPYEITFGRTGGFTNVTVEFMIRENREVFRITNGQSTKTNKITARKMKEIRNLIDSVGFKNLTPEEPGNVNYFIKVQHPEYENRVQWSDPSVESPLNTLYHLLLTTIKQ